MMQRVGETNQYYHQTQWCDYTAPCCGNPATAARTSAITAILASDIRVGIQEEARPAFGGRKRPGEETAAAGYAESR